MSQTSRTLSARLRKDLEAIASLHGMTLSFLQQPCRRSHIVAARRDCYAYLREQGWSYPEIGGVFNVDHTTVLWSLSDRLKVNRFLRTVSLEGAA